MLGADTPRLEAWLKVLSDFLSIDPRPFGYCTIPGGMVDFWPTPGRPRNWITLLSLYVNAKARRRRYGSRVLAAICRCADAHGYTILIRPKAYGGNHAPRPTTARLRLWYGKHGFVTLRSMPIYMVRRPRPESLDDANV